MSSASLVLFVTVCSVLLAGCLAKPTARILDGVEADTVSFPYMVSVRLDGAHVCGGSIVASKFIVTAAHCVSQLSVTPVAASRVTIRAGSVNQYAGGKLYSVAKIDINSGYNSFLNDVAVLELQTELVLGPRVEIIPLADSNEAVAAGDAVTVAGWGNTVSEGAFAYKLHFDTAEVLSQTECDESIGYGLASTLCLQSAAQKGSCFGDAGGPAVFGGKLVGISNFVIGACGTKYPDVFAKVSYFASFINSIINPA